MEVNASAFVDTATGASLDFVAGIAGIERVRDADPTVPAASDETDNQLRKRAKAALRRSTRRHSLP